MLVESYSFTMSLRKRDVYARIAKYTTIGNYLNRLDRNVGQTDPLIKYIKRN